MPFDARPTIFEESERQLFRLIYVSRPAASTAGRSGAAVGEILAQSLRNNPRYEVTSLLLVHDGWFLQLLEGPRSGVRATYRRIERDPRHEGLVTLSAETADERLFGQWSLCARFMGEVDPALLVRQGLGRDFHPLEYNGRQLTKLLTAVGEAHANSGFVNVQELRARLNAA